MTTQSGQTVPHDASRSNKPGREFLASWHERWHLGLFADNQSPAWAISTVVHLGLLLLVSLMSFAVPLPFVISLAMPNTEVDPIPEAFHFDDHVTDEIGALSDNGYEVALAAAPELADLSEIVTQPEMNPLDEGNIQFSEELEVATTPLDTSTKLVRGLAGVGVTGASGAIDRITHEIRLSLEDNDTLVVWLFDQSASLIRQRDEIQGRMQRIYEELGLIEENMRRGGRQSPLLSAVMQFGSKTSWLIERPTESVEEIQEAVRSVTLDESGVEHVFSAVYQAADKFRRLRSRRNVMLIAVTDEVGDDQLQGLEQTVEICRQNSIPVYVLGVPAAFGQSETMLKWVDPNPNYDQTPRWGRVNQGPESLQPERVHLPFGPEDEAIDSGFGPFALTRLCYQTGGIYFTIHPNRNVERVVDRNETSAFASYLSHFFDPQRMRPYRPDYVSPQEYQRQVSRIPSRAAVVQASTLTVARMDSPQTHFIKRDEAEFAEALTEAQKIAAKLEPKVNSIYEILRRGEESRKQEDTLRWQAAFDLAYGQTLAVVVRTRGYNEMLAAAKRGIEPTEPNFNTWTLLPSNEVLSGGRLSREADLARHYLTRVVKEHAGTPWALLAQRELEVPFGWKWEDSYTPLEPEQTGPPDTPDEPERPLRDEQRRMLTRPTTRDVPKL